jgi:methyltransferase (TIGR00027 family)
VAVDFASEPLGPALESAGFDPQAVTTWVWEGVVPYLTADEVRATVAEVARLSATASRLVVNYQARSLPTSVMRSLMRGVLRVARLPDPLAGEPWRSLWSPEQVSSMVARNGFDVTSDDDLLTLSEGLVMPPDNKGSLRNGRVALAVRR